MNRHTRKAPDNDQEMIKNGDIEKSDNMTSPIFVCVATGPSVTQDQIDLLMSSFDRSQLEIICVNDSWRWKYQDEFIGDHVYAADPPWWGMYREEIVKEGFKGKLWIPMSKASSDKYDLNLVPFASKPGLGKDGKVHSGSHSGYQAINLAYMMGAKKILLLGYDMKVANDGKIHFFGSHPKGLRNTPAAYARWIKNYEPLAKDLKDERVEVINCNPDSAIPFFTKVPLKNVQLSKSNS